MRQKKLFIDKGAWFAAADKSDKYHEHAVQIYRNLLRDYQLLTTNLVISETYTLIQRAIGHQVAIRFLNNIGASLRIIKVYSDNILEETAIKILRQYQDHDFSYTDAVSFAAMEQYEITEAFAFDHHFVTAGFRLVP